jgi:hypothetical protein
VVGEGGGGQTRAKPGGCTRIIEKTKKTQVPLWSKNACLTKNGLFVVKTSRKGLKRMILGCNIFVSTIISHYRCFRARSYALLKTPQLLQAADRLVQEPLHHKAIEVYV